MSDETVALLVAAGTGERLGGSTPKPYLTLAGESVMRRAARAFIEHPGIDGVRVVIRREHHAHYKRAMEGLTLFPCVIGGKTRQESVRLGLESFAHRPPKRVLVHDVARPLASHGLITRVLEKLKQQAAVVPALPIVDTVKRAAGEVVVETVSRENLYGVQTPQGFDYHILLDAHRRLEKESLTDDAALMEKLGLPVSMVPGEPGNVKITTQTDWERMQHMLSTEMETRTGFGYDVHALKPHDPDTPVVQQHIKLCGVRITSTYFLEGHSDADVGLHALVDAILGAMGAGDIGMHFPPDDPRWQGADSERFLLYAYQMLVNRGGELKHLDVTLICEKPKIAPHREQMIAHIAQLLKIQAGRISIKATTTEKLGFTGRGEGIAAQAVATITLPRT